ncbi:hypothetical protein KGM_215155 [Danaus plexippus plexippus]|uniref:Uncharacterized protein n=1 Tax=Danaus plexippus plexippus TaxID=278856 RepID=A0A212F7E6_DANPL|nr:hypothetical protein KGM_215155 [Danaus plexippus plexippus]
MNFHINAAITIEPRRKVDKPDDVSDGDTDRRRATRNRKQTDTMTPQTAARPVRSSRARLTEQEDREGNRRTRGKKAQETSTVEAEKETSVESVTASPAEKPRPKRTRRARKVSEKQENDDKTENDIEKKESDLEIKPVDTSDSEARSPVLQTIVPKTKLRVREDCGDDADQQGRGARAAGEQPRRRKMNETVVLDKQNRTEDKRNDGIMNETVVLEKDKAAAEPGDDSLLTDDESLEMKTPPNRQLPEPTSAVKEKVQQFEEMATRVTRTKTRAMTKKEVPVDPDTQTPPDRTRPVISTDTLSKMNNLIFNGKPPQISSSASKPRSNIPMKTSVTASASKISVARDDERREKEDARRKKEAILEAKKEMQRRKREEKMSAAAAARTAAENMRRAALQAAEKERRERQIQADQGRMDRLKEVEKKKLEQARKAAETEERRKLEEAARASRLQNEQRKVEEARRRQLEEEKIMKKEAAQMQKEIERRQREFMERMKMKKLEGDRTPNKMAAIEPVYMQDGFQHLNSDEEEPPERPPPVWSTSKNRRIQLSIQSRISQHHIDRLFSVREHTPDLREIFPNIERARLKRTSSAVWRTPPRLATLDE